MVDSDYFQKILEKLEVMELELRQLTSKIDTIDAKDLPKRMNKVESDLGNLKVNQAKVYAGITVIAFLVPLLLKVFLK
jgi:hypothetical protein